MPKLIGATAECSALWNLPDRAIAEHLIFNRFDFSHLTCLTEREA
ncbi:hypothetical protein [Mesorhizobium sp. ORS 3428]|nr:hypothetical protein [Mesorhizobium sp. ORS 3428]